eukprot:gene20175-46598_t
MSGLLGSPPHVGSQGPGGRPRVQESVPVTKPGSAVQQVGAEPLPEEEAPEEEAPEPGLETRAR